MHILFSIIVFLFLFCCLCDMDHYARLSVMAQLNGNNWFFKSNCQVGHN